MLHELMQKYGSDKFDHGYCPFYERYFGPIRQDVKAVLEIGIADGASIRAFLEYFPNAEVWGMDATPFLPSKYGDAARWPLDNPRFHAAIGDQAKRADLQALIARGAPWDIVIDDGGHTMDQQQVSLGMLLPHTRRFYVVEDLHSSFMDEITIYEDGQPVRSYPTNPNGLLTTYELLKDRENTHIFDRDGDGKHVTALLEAK